MEANTATDSREGGTGGGRQKCRGGADSESMLASTIKRLECNTCDPICNE